MTGSVAHHEGAGTICTERLHRSGGERGLEVLERDVGGVVPRERATRGKKVRERTGSVGEILNMFAIIIGEAQEGAKIARGGGDRPGADGVDLPGSTATPLCETTCPRKSSSVRQNAHLLGFAKR